jgi:hypothetical protein
MRVANFTDPQFVDANGLGGLNAAFSQVSGAIGSMGSGVWALPGLLSPETMSLGFGGLIASINLPSPWGIVSASGTVIRAHGTQTGAETSNYTVDFTPLVPGSVPVTAYLAASITMIQQNSFPLTGPPQGHPSFNPNFMPTTAYAANVYSVALSAVTGGIDNISTFELARMTLTPGQVSISNFSTAGWKRAAPLDARPAIPLTTGGLLSLAQAPGAILPAVAGLTSTLPSAASGGGISYQLINPLATSWTIVAINNNTITGAGGTPVNSMGIPPGGAATVWGNASGAWEVVSVNPLMMASLPNLFTALQTFASGLTVSGAGGGPASITMIGNPPTPSKTLRVANGSFNVVNDAQTNALLSVDDSGNLNVLGQISGNGLTISGSGLITNGLSVSNGGIVSSGFDAGGFNTRFTSGNGPSAGFRNDGSSFYLLLSPSAAGGFTGARPFAIDLHTGVLTIDGGGASVNFGGKITAQNVVATSANIGQVTFPGQGQINTAGQITTSAAVVAAVVDTTTGNITAGARLRAAFGALGTTDANAATILNDFPITKSGAGEVQLPNGLIIQWGSIQVPVDGQFHLYNFNTAFPTACYHVFGQMNAFGPVAGQCWGAQPATKSQFYVALATTAVSSNVDGFSWMAIGI